jgi:CHAT domain-containing protein/tetratricopeptide (TPR) repeat protein
MDEIEEPERAIEYLDRALEVLTKVTGEKSIPVARTLNNLGIARQLAGDDTGAREAYERCLAIRAAILPADHPDIASVLTNLGMLAMEMGDTARAADLGRRALAIFTKSSGPANSLTLKAQMSLGTSLHRAGQNEEAKEVLEASLAGREKALGPDHIDVAESLAGLGTLRVDTGQPERALPLLERALAIREKVLGPDSPIVAASLADLARCEAALGRLAAARSHGERALAIREARDGPEHPEVARSLSDLADFLFAGESPDEALPFALRSAEILARHARETMAALPESQALLLVDGQPHPEETLFSGLLEEAGRTEGAAGGWLAACWDWILARRGAVLEELARRNRRGAQGGTPEAREAWRRLAEARTRLARLWVQGDRDDPEAYRRALDAARNSREAAEIDLARASAVYRDAREDVRAGLDEVRRALPAGSALVEWVRVRCGPAVASRRPWHDVALVLGPGDAMRDVDLGASEEIDALVASWRKALADSAWIVARARPAGRADPMAEVTERGEALRRRIWDPIAGRIDGARHVYLVPDGMIHAVDFAALPDRGRYLIETGPSIQILSTGRDLARYARRAGGEAHAPDRGALALGAPDFDATPEAQRLAMTKSHGGPPLGADFATAFRGPAPACLDPARAHWQAIPASGREAERVAGLLRGHEPALALTGAAASETRFKQEAPGRRVLHLATHGFFVDETCDGRPRPQGQATPAAANPLLMSGLVLAGANRGAHAPATDDDGILTAEELAALDLSAADLVVLSACDTGRGEVSIGEGIFGLRRALEIAGAHSVVMSLFPVPDRQASRFMDRFYRARLDGRPTPEAARSASLQALEDLRRSERPAHPYYWSGFVTAGDWR